MLLAEPSGSVPASNGMERHVPVLLQESIDGLNISLGGVFLDCTLGSAGHALEVFKRFGNKVRIIGIDADPSRVSASQKMLADAGCNAGVFCENFRNLDKVLREANASDVSAILFDLGLNSEQLESSGRGFSFLRDEPLLMTFGEPSAGVLTAREIVNNYDEAELEKILREYGEERQAKGIARAIVEKRKEKPVQTTSELVAVIQSGYRGKYPRSIHFATRTFQALRMAVNDEVGALEEGLKKAFSALARQGRAAVISFHSIEDRLVKRYFKECAARGEGILINKKPITSSDAECKSNPR